MKAQRIEVTPVVVSLPETFPGSKYSISERSNLITRIHTDQGTQDRSRRALLHRRDPEPLP